MAERASSLCHSVGVPILVCMLLQGKEREREVGGGWRYRFVSCVWV